MKKITVRLLLIVFLCSIFLMLRAKGQTEPDGHPEDPVPLDPGSWVLVAAGVGYGVKKWRDTRHKANPGEQPGFSQEKK